MINYILMLKLKSKLILKHKYIKYCINALYGKNHYIHFKFRFLRDFFCVLRELYSYILKNFALITEMYCKIDV